MSKPIYSIDQLLDDRNRALYAELASRMQIKLVESDDSGWGSKSEEQTIYCSNSRYPISCFTHELLHLKLESEGMKCPQFVADDPNTVNEVLGFFHNQLVHHKMFPLFVRLGFPAAEFLNDDDGTEMPRILERDIKTLEKRFAKGKRPFDGAAIALPYLSIKSPHENKEVFRQLEARLRKVSNPTTVAALDQILHDWVATDNPNCSRPLARLFKACGIFEVGFTLTGLPDDIVYATDDP